jgi:hypothetical protein
MCSPAYREPARDLGDVATLVACRLEFHCGGSRAPLLPLMVDAPYGLIPYTCVM